MIHTYATTERERIEFAEAAALHFRDNPKHSSYSLNESAPGERLAMRWGLGDDCVLVLTVGDDMPMIFGQLITKVVRAP